MGPGTTSPCSSRSAIKHSTNAWTATVACFRVRPYAVTPGKAGTSASHLPCSSRWYSSAKEKLVGDFGWNLRRKHMLFPILNANNPEVS